MLSSSQLRATQMDRLRAIIEPHCANMPPIKHNAQANFYFLTFPLNTQTHLNKLVSDLASELGFAVTLKSRKFKQLKEYVVSIPITELSLFLAQQQSDALEKQLRAATKRFDAEQSATQPWPFKSAEQIMCEGVEKWLLTQKVHKATRRSTQFFNYAKKFTVTASDKRIFVNFDQSCFRYHPSRQWILDYLDEKLRTPKERKSYIDINRITGAVIFSLARDVCEKAFGLEYSPTSILKQRILEQDRRRAEFMSSRKATSQGQVARFSFK